MASRTAHGHRGMDRSAFGFVFVTLQAGLRVRLWIQWDGVLACESHTGCYCDEYKDGADTAFH